VALGPGHLAAVISVVTHEPRAPDHYKGRLAGLTGLSRVTVEVVPCPGVYHHLADKAAALTFVCFWMEFPVPAGKPSYRVSRRRVIV
jgi:hypothetical protein